MQPNSKDCGCFVVYFGKKFFNDPMGTVAVIKVRFSISFCSLLIFDADCV